MQDGWSSNPGTAKVQQNCDPKVPPQQWQPERQRPWDETKMKPAEQFGIQTESELQNWISTSCRFWHRQMIECLASDTLDQSDWDKQMAWKPVDFIMSKSQKVCSRALQLTAENCRSAILGQEPHHKVCSDNFNWSLIWFITQNQGWTGSLPMERIPIIPRSEKFEIGETTWMLRWHANWVLLSRRNWITFWFWCMCLSICRPRFRSHYNLDFSLEASPVNHGVPANATPMTTCNSTSVG